MSFAAAVPSPPSFDISSPSTSTDAIEIKVVMNSGSNDEENEPIPDESFIELEIQNDVNTLTDLSIQR